MSRLVLLDIGGVLIRIRTWDRALRAGGLSAARCSTLLPRLGELETLWLEFEGGACGWEVFQAQLFERFGLAPAESETCAYAILDQAFPGTAELVNDLRRAGLKLGTLSNTNPFHWAHMASGAGPFRLPFDGFEFPFTSFQLGELKPGPEIYAAAESLSGHQPASIAFFDDRAENVRAALERGWCAGRIDPESSRPPAQQIRAQLRRWSWIP
ncbi:MAG: hypothetical protein RL095_3194 [Verrucomicrobiota bacterium]|jgi:HAD superfamily hydrolase (TIGR01509 family)